MPQPTEQTIPTPTCFTLHQHHQHLQQLIYTLETQLQRLVEEYWITLSSNQKEKEKLLTESYYINELIGYVKQQCSLALHYESYLRDFQPDQQFTYRAFFDYLQDQTLRKRCQQKLSDDFYRNVWLKQLEYLKKQYVKNNNMHAVSKQESGEKQFIGKNPEEVQEQLVKGDMRDYEIEGVVGGMRW